MGNQYSHVSPKVGFGSCCCVNNSNIVEALNSPFVSQMENVNTLQWNENIILPGTRNIKLPSLNKSAIVLCEYQIILTEGRDCSPKSSSNNELVSENGTLRICVDSQKQHWILICTETGNFIICKELAKLNVYRSAPDTISILQNSFESVGRESIFFLKFDFQSLAESAFKELKKHQN